MPQYDDDRYEDRGRGYDDRRDGGDRERSFKVYGGRAVVLGTLVEDPYVHQSGSFTSLRIAVNSNDGYASQENVAAFESVMIWGNKGKEWGKAVAAESLRKGDRVIVSGPWYDREFERKDGTRGQSRVYEIAQFDVTTFVALDQTFFNYNGGRDGGRGRDREEYDSPRGGRAREGRPERRKAPADRRGGGRERFQEDFAEEAPAVSRRDRERVAPERGERREAPKSRERSSDGDFERESAPRRRTRTVVEEN